MKETSTLKEKQYIENNILVALHEFCKKHSLNFMLDWGTLLGAVRHRGFIPWDDDIDVIMSLSDYIKLCELKDVFNHEMKKNYLKMQTPFDTSKGMYSWGCRIYDTRTSYVNTTGLFSPGICVDVTFFENTPENKFECYLYRRKKRFLYKLHGIRHNINGIPKSRFKRVVKKIIRPLVKCIKENYFYNKIVAQDMHMISRESSYFWQPLGILNFPNEKITYKREWIMETVKLEFNGKQYDAPKGWHEILTQYYGDYMILPPYEERTEKHAHGGAYMKENFDNNNG